MGVLSSGQDPNPDGPKNVPSSGQEEEPQTLQTPKGPGLITP